MKQVTKKVFFALFCVFLLNNLFAQNWTKIIPNFSPTGDYNLRLGTFANENTGWAVSKCGRIWKTNDGGHNWFMQKDSSGFGFVDIDFIDSQCGWLSCYIDYPEPSFLLRTVDGGQTWKTIFLPDTAIAGPFQIAFHDSLEGFAGGWNNQFYYTNNAGRTWIDLTKSKDLFGFIYDISFSDSLHGWAVGGSYYAFDCGTIINTSDGGQTWNSILPDTYELTSIDFINTLHGCATGFDMHMYGLIMLTFDGGISWIDIGLQSPPLYDVKFINDSTAWTIGHFGYIWNTQDSGKTWIQVESNTNVRLNRIEFIDNNRIGYIFGDSSTVLKYTYDISSIDNDNFPAQFTLSQNYPNPFNPTTTISYELPEAQNITLQIFDITGQLVETLYNGYKEAGHWDVTWNASDQSSGIYIYRLQVGDQHISKKMLLIK